MVKFGIKPAMWFQSGEHEVAPTDQFKKIITLTRTARDAGFHSLWVGQHYFSGKRPNWEAIPTLARLIPEAGGMTIGTCVLLLPLHHPVLVAEQSAVLDILSGGKFVLGVGLGYREREFGGFGISRRERVSRFEEALSVIQSLWTGGRVAFRGRHLSVNGVTTGTLPVQKPRCPIWIAAHGDRAVQRAARLGDSLIMNPHASLETLERQVELYKAALQAESKPFPRELAIRRDICIAKDRKTAWKEAEEDVPGLAEHLMAEGQDKELPASDGFSLRQGLPELIRSRFIVGDPDDCVEQIDAYRRRLGVNHFILRVACPDGGLRAMGEKTELIGRKVIDAFDKASS